MRTITISIILAALFIGCGWETHFPYTKIKPNEVCKQSPKDFEQCLTLLDSILKDEAKNYFKTEDSTIAVINIVSDSRGLGHFFIHNWYLDYRVRTNEIIAYDINLPRDTPQIVRQFGHYGVTSGHAMIRIIFSCYYKKLNHQDYNWIDEINRVQSNWVNSKVANHREDSIRNTVEYKKMIIGDTVTCWLRRGPRIFGKEPDSYYLTGIISEKRDSSKIINVKLTSIVTDKKSKGFILDDKTLIVGDTLSDFALNWHRKLHNYFDYLQNNYWPNQMDIATIEK